MNLFPSTSKIVSALYSNFEIISSDEITINFAYSFSKRGIFESHQNAFGLNNKIKKLIYVRSYSEYRFDFEKKSWQKKFSLRPYIFSKKIAFQSHKNFCRKSEIESDFIVLGVVYEVGAWKNILRKIKSLENKKISKNLLNKKIFTSSLEQISYGLNKINSNLEHDSFIGSFITFEEFLNINNIPFEMSIKSTRYDFGEILIKFLNLFDFDLCIKFLGKMDPFFYLLRELINER
tara:strand:+ start:244 stop:945 length:702 start_codon:yes stop_codon:yes gene_type:complete